MADPGPSSTDALPGALRVTVLAARDLTPKNKNGLSNPYAKVKVNDDLSFKTGTPLPDYVCVGLRFYC